MEKNIQIKIKNSTGGYDILYPKTKAELIEGLDGLLNAKVDIVEGKGLSTNDYTTDEKNKLNSIEAGAQVNSITSVAGKTGIVTLSKTDVGLENVENKSSATIRGELTSSNISTALGFTPENSALKDVANGYAGLDENGKLAISQIPDTGANKTFVVVDTAERLALQDIDIADKCYETTTGDSYIYDGTQWLVLADADWQNVNLQWSNIVGKPTSSVANLDDAVTKRHEHINKSILDKVIESVNNESYDISMFVTQQDLQITDYGDMKKEVYDADGDGIVDLAKTAEQVDWAGIQNKPATFTPSTHLHDAAEITETADKQFVSATQKTSWNSKITAVVSTVEPTNQNVNDMWYEEII